MKRVSTTEQQPQSFEFSAENKARCDDSSPATRQHPGQRGDAAAGPGAAPAPEPGCPGRRWIAVAELPVAAAYCRLRSRRFLLHVRTQAGGEHFVAITNVLLLMGSMRLSAACRKPSSGISLVRPRPTTSSPLIEVECLGACVNAPMFQVNDDTRTSRQRARSRSAGRWRAASVRRHPGCTAHFRAGRRADHPEGLCTTLQFGRGPYLHLRLSTGGWKRHAGG